MDGGLSEALFWARDWQQRAHEIWLFQGNNRNSDDDFTA